MLLTPAKAGLAGESRTGRQKPDDLAGRPSRARPARSPVHVAEGCGALRGPSVAGEAREILWKLEGCGRRVQGRQRGDPRCGIDPRLFFCTSGLWCISNLDS